VRRPRANVMKVSLLAGGYPPDLDGIGDYTFFLAQALAARTDIAKPVTVYTRKGEHEHTPGVRVSPFFEFARPSSIRELLPLVAQESPDWLVLQYNPFCWGARGFCPALPPTLRHIKSLPHGPKLAVMFHETTVPKWPWRFAILYAWQRPILRAVARQADAVFVSTKRWIPELQSAGSRVPATLLPVGSNIPRSNLSREEARSRLGIGDECLVLGIFGGAHPSRLLDWIAEAARAVQLKHKDLLVLHVGPEGDVMNFAMLGLPFRTLGPKPAAEAADALRSMDCLVSPFIDGVSTRRSSVMAALNNGLPVATTRRDWTDDYFLHVSPEVLLASSARDSGGFTKDFVQWLRSRPSHAEATVEKAHDEYFAWHRVSGRLIEVLRM
jgi:glycosyltransferase involved in cell wall biosynthesis